MAGFNPFAPQVDKKTGAPQLPGVPAPQPQAEQPGMMQTVAPAVFEKAMGSDEAGAIKDWGVGKAKEAWNAFKPASTNTPTAQSVMNTSIPVSELSSTMGTAISPSAMLGGGAEGAIAAQQAAQAAAMPAHLALGAETMAAGTGLATAAGGGTVAGAAPLALAAGPFAPLVLMGAGLLAANSGK